jgi:hypothetical protein
MIRPTIEAELLEVLKDLGWTQQRQVLDFAQFLKSGAATPPGTPGRDFLQFAGSITESDARLMEEAVAEGRRVDPNEW